MNYDFLTTFVSNHLSQRYYTCRTIIGDDLNQPDFSPADTFKKVLPLMSYQKHFLRGAIALAYESNSISDDEYFAVSNILDAGVSMYIDELEHLVFD